MINFDNSATSFPKPKSVRTAVMNAISKYGGNPGRSGHRLSIETATKVFESRMKIADFFGAEPENVVFTLNCTHALNLAIKGIMKDGGHIIISSLEHNSVARPVYALSQENVTFSVAEVSADDNVTVDNFRKLITSETRAVVCMIASNVTGKLLPYKQIARLCNERNICFIADGAQGCGLIPIKLSDGINILCTSGHKSLYGIAGTGLFITDGKYAVKHIMEGGTGSTSLELKHPDFMPDSLESGTINTAGAISVGAGIDFINSLLIKSINAHETRLCERFIDYLRSNNRYDVYRNSNESYIPVVSFNVKNYNPNDVAQYLSDNGFALRGGLHCSGMAHRQLGTLPEGTVRFAPSVFNTEQEVNELIDILDKYE